MSRRFDGDSSLSRFANLRRTRAVAETRRWSEHELRGMRALTEPELLERHFRVGHVVLGADGALDETGVAGPLRGGGPVEGRLRDVTTTAVRPRDGLIQRRVAAPSCRCEWRVDRGASGGVDTARIPAVDQRADRVRRGRSQPLDDAIELSEVLLLCREALPLHLI